MLKIFSGKKRTFLAIVLLLIFVVFELSGCASWENFVPSENISVTISDGAAYRLEESHFVIERGEDVIVRLELREGFSLCGCSYPDYTFTQSEGGGTLTLRHVIYPVFVTLDTAGDAQSVYYDLNGGVREDGSAGFTVKAPSTHLRANTDTGLGVYREGYSLTGWNTSPDGSGQHIGLGSRVTLSEDGLILYAEWLKAAESGQFDYAAEDGGITLLSYLGPASVEKLVIPDSIDGLPVKAIASGFASGADIKTLVLPRWIEAVEDGAFVDCGIQELFMPDGITSISDASFGSNIKTLHINAVVAPKYQTGNEIAWFADMMDKLILASGDKKIVFFGGCSFAYGLDSERVYEHFGEEYKVFNMGIIGGTNAAFQIECITSCIGEGDIFVHAPEVGSAYQLMYNTSAEHRMFVMVEGNYDLLSLCNLAETDGVFDSFQTYNLLRSSLPDGDYSDSIDAFNEFGDISRERIGGRDISYTVGYTYETGYLTEASMDKMCSYYGEIEHRGGRVLFSFSPVNWHGLTREERNEEVWNDFESVIAPYLEERGIPVISDAAKYCMYGRYFYDTNYHLSDEGAEMRTNFLIADLDAFICA